MSIVVDSTYSAGFPRWERARVNSLISPESPAAELYRQRVAVADKVESEVTDCTFAFYHTEYKRGAVEFRVCSVACAALEIQLKWDNETAGTVATKLRHAQYNGHYELAYAPSLNATVASLHIRANVFPNIQAKCRTCWSVIDADGKVSKRVDSSPVLDALWEKEMDFVYSSYDAELDPAPLLGVVSPAAVTAQEWQASVPSLYMIDENGTITALENCAIVRLTSGQLDILQNYCDDGQRAEYGEDRAIQLDLSVFID